MGLNSWRPLLSLNLQIWLELREVITQILLLKQHTNVCVNYSPFGRAIYSPRLWTNNRQSNRQQSSYSQG